MLRDGPALLGCCCPVPYERLGVVSRDRPIELLECVSVDALPFGSTGLRSDSALPALVVFRFHRIHSNDTAMTAHIIKARVTRRVLCGI